MIWLICNTMRVTFIGTIWMIWLICNTMRVTFIGTLRMIRHVINAGFIASISNAIWMVWIIMRTVLIAFVILIPFISLRNSVCELIEMVGVISWQVDLMVRIIFIHHHGHKLIR